MCKFSKKYIFKVHEIFENENFATQYAPSSRATKFVDFLELNSLKYMYLIGSNVSIFENCKKVVHPYSLSHTWTLSLSTRTTPDLARIVV